MCGPHSATEEWFVPILELQNVLELLQRSSKMVKVLTADKKSHYSVPGYRALIMAR
jgi:hypothetical protein